MRRKTRLLKYKSHTQILYERKRRLGRIKKRNRKMVLVLEYFKDIRIKDDNVKDAMREVARGMRRAPHE